MRRRRAEGGFSLGQLAQLLMHAADVELRAAQVGIEPQGGAVMLGGLGQAAFFLQRPAQRVVRGGAIRFQRQDTLIACDGLRGFLTVHAQVAEVFPPTGVVRLQFHGLLHPRQGVVELSFALQGQAEIGKSRCQVGVQPQCFGVGVACLDQTIQVAQHVAEVVVQGSQIGLKSHGFQSVRQRFLGLTAIQ